MKLNLKQCPYCKTPIPEDSVYCDVCGEKLRYCPSCGAFAKSKRCAKCGHPTEEINAGEPASNPNSKHVPGHLVCMSANIRLGLSHEAIIGRRGNYGNTFQQFHSVSGNHAQLLCVEGIWQIRDLGSSFGTYLNGEKLEKNKPTPINVNDILKFADVEFLVSE